MQLESVRELKRSLADLMGRETLTRAAAFAAGTPVLPLPALGVHVGGMGDFRLAVRVTDDAGRGDPLVAQIERAARGEVDVRVVGPIEKQSLRDRCRPLRIGCSIGDSTCSGTLGGFVRKPGHDGLFILSNNHVLADGNRSATGAAILQPGGADGGLDPEDRVAALADSVPLDPQIENAMDSAIARVDGGIDADLAGLDSLGALAGLFEGEAPEIGPEVAKVGRTTGVTRGRVTAFEVDHLVVRYGIGLIRFRGQLEIEGAESDPFSRSGDSGSLIVDNQCLAVAQLFAGSTMGGGNGQGLTYATPLRRILARLGVELVWK